MLAFDYIEDMIRRGIASQMRSIYIYIEPHGFGRKEHNSFCLFFKKMWPQKSKAKS